MKTLLTSVHVHLYKLQKLIENEIIKIKNDFILFLQGKIFYLILSIIFEETLYFINEYFLFVNYMIKSNTDEITNKQIICFIISILIDFIPVSYILSFLHNKYLNSLPLNGNYLLIKCSKCEPKFLKEHLEKKATMANYNGLIEIDNLCFKINNYIKILKYPVRFMTILKIIKNIDLEHKIFILFVIIIIEIFMLFIYYKIVLIIEKNTKCDYDHTNSDKLRHILNNFYENVRTFSCSKILEKRTHFLQENINQENKRQFNIYRLYENLSCHYSSFINRVILLFFIIFCKLNKPKNIIVLYNTIKQIIYSLNAQFDDIYYRFKFSSNKNNEQKMIKFLKTIKIHKMPKPINIKNISSLTFTNILFSQNSFTLYNKNAITLNKGLNVISGESGSGKTTFCRIVANFIDEPKNLSMTCLINNEVKIIDYQASVSLGKITGWLIQAINNTASIIPYFNTSIIELINNDTVSNEVVIRLINSLRLEKCIPDLTSKISWRTLSGGETQRVLLLYTFINSISFEIVILDEPLEGLDKITKEYVIRTIKSEIENGCLKNKIIIAIFHEEINDTVFIPSISIENGVISMISKN
jgi:ABC-type transport system involved in cytochrome bd biosynthesis fused ATPase/permease subunit